MIGAGVAWSLRTFMKEEHNCYITLPLYHGNALAVAFSAVVTAGASATLRPKFSVSNFFDDVKRFGCTHMVYIGELWRYLLDRHPQKEQTTLHTIFGNGLHKELWQKVISRYHISHVVEHFGATEMPASALTNWMDVPGYCGYLPPSHPDNEDIKLIDEKGEEVLPNTPGEAIFRVPNNRYRGYLDPALDKPKIMLRDGLQWWRSGDLLKRNEEGFFTFVDRVGDSYRFKGENIASADVEKVLMASGLFEEAVVYGIRFPGIEGKIGMASLLPKTSSDEKKLGELLLHLRNHLADYALPFFLRIQDKKHATTSTMKIQKKALSEEGISNYWSAPHFILHEGRYQKIDDTLFKALQEGKIIPGRVS
jgi:fatty-acyl-CoA synthase